MNRLEQPLERLSPVRHGDDRQRGTLPELVVLGIFGEEDAVVPPEAAEALHSRLEEKGVRASVQIEPGVGHGFMNETRADVYNAVAAGKAWDDLLSFLRGELA